MAINESLRARPGARPVGAIRSFVASFRHSILAERLPVAALVSMVGAAFALRYGVFLRYPTPPASDYGLYLTELHSFLGDDVTGDGVHYPPVFLLYLWMLTSLAGEMSGLQVSGPLLASALGLPTYLLLRNFARPWLALVGATIVTISELSSELIAWGGNANLLAMVFGTASLAWLLKWHRRGRRVDLIISSLLFGLAAASHQISGAFYGLVGLLMVGGLLLLRARRVQIQRAAMSLGAFVLAALPSLPLYRITDGSSYLFYRGPVLLSIANIAYIVQWMFRDALWVWLGLSVLAVLGVASMKAREDLLLVFAVALLVSPFLMAFTILSLHPIRPLVFLPLGIVVGATFFVDCQWGNLVARRPSRKIGTRRLVLASVCAVAVILVLSSATYRRQVAAVDWYMVLSPDVMQALDWIRENAPAGATIATTGPAKFGPDAWSGCLWGWWIEGYSRRRSLCTDDVQTFAWDAQVRSSTDANRALMGASSLENGRVVAGDTAPFGAHGNPMIAGDFGRSYQPLLSFRDGSIEIRWLPRDGAMEQVKTIPNLDRYHYAATSSVDRGQLELLAQGDDVAVRRTVEIHRDSSEVTVNYEIDSMGSIRALTVEVFSTTQSFIERYDGLTHTAFIGGVSPGMAGQIHLLTGSESLASDPIWDHSYIRFDFAPDAPSFSASFVVRVGVANNAPSLPVSVVEATDIFSAYNVGYVLVDRARLRELEWFSKDISRYALAYKNGSVTIFRVID